MPPKGNQPSNKTVQKEKQKMIDDRTFGLKNKNKSKKVQEYIQQVTKNVQSAKYPGQAQAPPPPTAELNAKKREEEKKAQLMAMMRASLKQPPIPDGANPKDFVCIYHVHGCCEKGDKCRYSHDLGGGSRKDVAPQKASAEAEAKASETITEAERLANERSEAMGRLDLFRDMREQLMEYNAKIQSAKSGKSYEALLEEYRERYHAKQESKTKSEKICPQYLSACKAKSIGWGFRCKNEEKNGYCPMRHCLPEGYVLEEPKPQELDKDLDYEEIEDAFERRRQEITSGTPVTLETFRVWKEKRLAIQEARRKAEAEQLEQVLSQHKNVQLLTGRQLFENATRVGLKEEDCAEPETDADAWMLDRADLRELKDAEANPQGACE